MTGVLITQKPPIPKLSALQIGLAGMVGLASVAALVASVINASAPQGVLLFSTIGILSLLRFKFTFSYWLDLALVAFGALALLSSLGGKNILGADFWFALIALWILTWLFVERLSAAISVGTARASTGVLVPVLFGAALLLIWELITRGAQIPTILLPPPTMIWERILVSLPILWADFQQTFLKAVLAGYFLGCSAGFLVAIAIDRSPFLKRGLLPLGSFVSALPIIGIAPIMVSWFGFDWQSKAAVVAVMTFFPMLVNAVAGLNEAGQMERDLMRTYAANYWRTLWHLRLPAAAPFIFNALKINTTLALIGAIVAEFFGTPVVGMGFRISTEIGRMNVDMVWAEIAVAALAGSAFYGVATLIERIVTFWHPSVRAGRA